MPRNPNPTRPTHQAELLAWLDQRQAGALMAEILADAREKSPGIKSDTVSCRVCRLLDLGLIGYTIELGTGRGRPERRRYYSRRNCPPDATLQAQHIPLRRPARAEATPRIKPGRGPIIPEGPQIIPAGLKVTVCPAGKDQRFTPTGSEPFFSRGGAVLPVSPWVQAITGGRP